MAERQAKTFQVDDAQLLFRNFEGKESQYNRKGDRNFTVILEDTAAEQMAADGWNVRYLEPREEGDTPTPVIQVAVGYKIRPPRVVILTSNSRTQLGEKEVELLDWADFEKVDLICRGSFWEVNGKSGIKAYLQTLVATILEDDLEKRYNLHGEPPTIADESHDDDE